MQKKTYKLSILSYIAVSVVIFFVTFFTFLFTGAYFSSAQIVVGQITLGQLDFRVLNNFSQITLSENNLFMPDEIIYNSIRILNARNDEGTNVDGLVPFFVRIQPILELNNEPHLEFLQIVLNNPTKWVQGSDKYLYYKGTVAVGEQIIFNDYFTLSYLIDNSYENAPLLLALKIDTIQTSENAYINSWITAPQEWLDSVANLF